MASDNLSPTDSLDSPSLHCERHHVDLKIDSFGVMAAAPGDSGNANLSITRFTWKTRNNMQVQVITYGATITSIKVPDRHGNAADVVLGFDSMEGYQQSNNPYFGATVGRVANRTAGGAFTLGGINYTLSQNRPPNHLHGGFRGFDKVNWDYHVEGSKVILSYLSNDGEEGYPGSVLTNLTYQVTADNIIKVFMESITTKPTPLNLTNHSYFNLAGHESGPSEIYDHVITINADKYTPSSETMITTGQILPVGDTLFDLRVPRVLLDLLKQVPSNGYNSNFCVTKGADQSVAFVSRVVHPKSGRSMEIYSDQPGVQFYTANFLPNPSTEGYSPLYGKSGAPYVRHGAFCLETQNLPNAVNYKNFPNSILYPGKKYTHNVEYKFASQN